MKGNIRSYKGEVADFTEVNSAEVQQWDRRYNDPPKEPEPEVDYHNDVNGEFMETKSNMSLFMKVGIMVLSLMLIIGAAAYVLPRAIPTSSAKQRKLPIYCVNTDQPKIALSFDAAWGNGTMRKNEKLVKSRIIEYCTQMETCQGTFFLYNC